jgi:two-component system sensor histidine kinase BaeS
MSFWPDRSWRSRRPAPSWWPENEPWPPRGASYLRNRRRARWRRRGGWWGFLPVWAFFWLMATSLIWRVPRALAGSNGAVVLLLIGAAIAGGVAIVVRRIATPVADIVSAAERIGKRDYKVRIDTPVLGPRWIANTARAFNAMASELESQDEARRHMMADIAHELRTPLAVVQGQLEGLIDGLYPRDNERLQELLEETRVLTRLVEDLRTLSTAESGALALMKEPTDLVTLGNDVASALAARAAEPGVSLTIEAPSEIEAVSLDPVRIREVLTNLTVNALRYTPRGGGVRLVLIARSDGVELRVIDTGAGIAVDELPRIFDRFYKGATSSGTGLGLTIARRLVEAHGGTIRAESRVGAGTTMIVFLPR